MCVSEEVWSTYVVRDVVLVLADCPVPNLVRLRDESVKFAIGVIARGPEGLPVVGILGAGEVLLLAGVDDGDAVCHDSEGGGVLGEGHVARVSVSISTVLYGRRRKQLTRRSGDCRGFP